MKPKSKRLLSTLMVVSLVFSLFAAFPLIASAEDGPIRVTLDPVGAIYQLNATAVPLKATFYYNTSNEQFIPDANAPLSIQWYWSATDSNTDRSNGLGETFITDWYSRIFEIPTTVTPATDTVGVKYYYAVLKYSVQQVAGAVIEIERETVTNTAKVEVIAPRDSQQSITVLKTDGFGVPLAGATIRVGGMTDSGIPRVFDEVTDSNGEAEFTLEPGTYDITEHIPPTGYYPSGMTVKIIVGADGVFIQNTPQNIVPYTTVQFSNRPIITLDKDKHFAFVQGYPEGDFRPDSNMSRAEAIVMFFNLLLESPDDNVGYSDAHYPDLAQSDWYANQIGYMYSKGALTDYSRDEFLRPDEPVTRAEFATLACHFEDMILTDVNIFSDVADDHWAVKYINSAVAKGWVQGYDVGDVKTFKPDSYMTRAEIVTLAGRVLDRYADSEYIAANLSTMPRSYPDIPDHWAYLPIMEASIGHNYDKDETGEHWTSVYIHD